MTRPAGSETASPGEVLLCDTSVASRLVAGSIPDAWSEGDRAALIGAIKAVSIVTTAEIRAGQIKAGWGERRRADADAKLASYLIVPFDRGVLDRWAALHAAAKRAGVSIGDNDLWIAATAIERGWRLASADRDHQRLADIDGVGLDLIAVGTGSAG